MEKFNISREGIGVILVKANEIFINE